MTNTSNPYQTFIGNTQQTVTLPLASTMVLGQSFVITNQFVAGTGSYNYIIVNSSGGNLVSNVLYGQTISFTCIVTSGTTAASWYAPANPWVIDNVYYNYVLGGTALQNSFSHRNSGSAAYNICIGGDNAFNALTSGSNNVAIGDDALQNVTTGRMNSAMGVYAGADNTSGIYNTYLGYGSGANNQTGNGNVYIGYYSGVNTVTNSNEFYLNNVQQTTYANDKAYSLVYGNFAGSAGSITNAYFQVNGNLMANHLVGSKSSGVFAVPKVTGGTGSGTGVSMTCTFVTGSTDVAGQINILTGTSPVGSAVVATITFNTAFTTTAPFVILEPANSATAALNGTSQVYVTATKSTFLINSGTAALSTPVTYSWIYHVIQ